MSIVSGSISTGFMWVGIYFIVGCIMAGAAYADYEESSDAGLLTWGEMAIATIVTILIWPAFVVWEIQQAILNHKPKP